MLSGSGQPLFSQFIADEHRLLRDGPVAFVCIGHERALSQMGYLRRERLGRVRWHISPRAWRRSLLWSVSRFSTRLMTMPHIVQMLIL